jgi:hypothetical protein
MVSKIPLVNAKILFLIKNEANLLCWRISLVCKYCIPRGSSLIFAEILAHSQKIVHFHKNVGMDLHHYYVAEKFSARHGNKVRTDGIYINVTTPKKIADRVVPRRKHMNATESMSLLFLQ